MNTRRQETRQRILQTTVRLILAKGYLGVTTKEIAREANVNEVTLFRHFGSKENIMKAMIEECSYLPRVEHLLAEGLVWELEADLLTLTRTYYDYFHQNKDLIRIAYRELGRFPELDRLLTAVPERLKQFLTQYFEQMHSRKKLGNGDCEMYAALFLSLQYGYLTTRVLHAHDFGVDEEAFIQESIRLFVQQMQS